MPTFWRFQVTGDKISRIDTGHRPAHPIAADHR